MILTECDDCGKILCIEEISTDYDNSHRCKKCDIENKLFIEKKRLKDNLDWLKNTHFKDLIDSRKRIKKLKQELEKSE